MRIIAGEKKGLRLNTLKGTDTRPTSGKVKESLFNRIGPYFDEGVVVELFGGSGSLSFEALSRGAAEAFIFDKSSKACAVIRSNAEHCRYTEVVHIMRADARKAVGILEKENKKVDFLLIDPPYAEEDLYDLAQNFVDGGLLSDKAIIVCEHGKRKLLPDAYGLYQKSNCTVYGQSAISIYRK